MIKRKKQKIISGYGYRIRNSKREFHAGLDLRSWNFKIWKRQPVIFPERCEFIRRWHDMWGGGCAYRGIETGYIFKSIHIFVNRNIIDGGVYDRGEIIGYSEKVRGIAEHEHYEVWLDGETKTIDPRKYFDEKRIKYGN